MGKQKVTWVIKNALCFWLFEQKESQKNMM